jgi:hypothetical protein
MARLLLISLLPLLCGLPVSGAEPTAARPGLLGTWEFQQPGALNSFIGYTTYFADGRCVQIGRGKTLGLTKWIYVESKWHLEGDQVVTAVMRSNLGIPAGKSTTSRILRLTESDFTYRESGDSNDRTEHRVKVVPPEYAKQLEALAQNR